ncbi:DUF305 domain-containing protein [Flexivirga oryzae]|uniref:Uncharacterized protein (DUF305 family) n=1 Tax=Flexivirga oryzae TaxID=1794944 RepID=A0A839NBE2_9MICO|nr:DUF305 domain-containing protein [Flexivirga oryzae]MBB2892041.1 uncharacterized protein (DUF305 family) [Flexivirga oryzae]
MTIDDPAGSLDLARSPRAGRAGAAARSGGTSARAWVLALGCVASAVVAVLLAGVVGYRAGDAVPGNDSAEAGFARDMQVHHAQAVQMAFIIRDKSKNPTIKTIAFDIINTQQQQAGQMFGWLEQWRLPQAATQQPMSWMPTTHVGQATTHRGASMPGMASQSQLTQLRSLIGPAADRRFLTLMIAHHRGGVTMAEAIQPLTGNAAVNTLAAAIETSQRAEIAQMTRLRATL